MVDVKLSPLDTQRFSVTVAKANAVTADNLDAIEAFCVDQQVQLLIARADAHQITAIQMMESRQFRLMDTLVYYQFDFTRKQYHLPDLPVTLRQVTPDDEPAVTQIARVSFDNYKAHYHADKHLPLERSNEVYIDWAVRSVTDRTVVDDMIVAEVDGQVVGFLSVRMNNSEDGELVLAGVLPEMRRHGVYRCFIEWGTNWCQAQGAKRALCSSQLTNPHVQRVWARIGYEYNHAFYTFHKWYDRGW